MNEQHGKNNMEATRAIGKPKDGQKHGFRRQQEQYGGNKIR